MDAAVRAGLARQPPPFEGPPRPVFRRDLVCDAHERSSGGLVGGVRQSDLDWNARAPGGPYGRERWAVSIGADGSTATLPPAPGDLPNGAPSAVVLPIAAPEGE